IASSLRINRQWTVDTIDCSHPMDALAPVQRGGLPGGTPPARPSRQPPPRSSRKREGGTITGKGSAGNTKSGTVCLSGGAPLDLGGGGASEGPRNLLGEGSRSAARQGPKRPRGSWPLGHFKT